jgi:hypothetical protein
MKVKIKKVMITSQDEFGEIYEYLTYGELNSGYEIAIISSSRIDPRKYLNQTVDCLILAYKLHEIQIEKELKLDLINKKIFGEFLGQYSIPQIWNFKDIISYDAIKTLDGIMLIYQRDFSNIDERKKIYYQIKIQKQLEIGDIISFYPEKFKLLSFIPVEKF